MKTHRCSAWGVPGVIIIGDIALGDSFHSLRSAVFALVEEVNLHDNQSTTSFFESPHGTFIG